MGADSRGAFKLDVNPAFVVLLGVETRASVPDSALRDKIEIGGGSEAIVEWDC